MGEGIHWMMPQVVGLLALVGTVHGVMAYRQQNIDAWQLPLPQSEAKKTWHVLGWFWLAMALLVWSPTNSSPFIYFQF